MEEEKFDSKKIILSTLILVTISIIFLIRKYLKEKDNINEALSNDNNNNNNNYSIAKNSIINKYINNNKSLLYKDIKTKKALINVDFNNYNTNLIDKVLINLKNKDYVSYIIVKVENNNEIDKISKTFDNVIDQDLIKKHRILFCSKIEGVVAVMRAISPVLLIDYCHESIIEIVRFILGELIIISNNKVNFPENYDKNKKISYVTDYESLSNYIKALENTK